MTIGPIFSSHVSMVNCILGWGDKISLVLEVEGMDCDCYENRDVSHYFNTLTS
jgi:hypothetical protein